MENNHIHKYGIGVITMKKTSLRFIAFVILCAFALSITSCANSVASNLVSGSPQDVEGKASDEVFSSLVSDFSIMIFKETFEDKNYISSPFSLMIGLGMLTNGATGETKNELESFIGMDEDLLAKYVSGYIDSLKSLEKNKVNIADSVWIRHGKNVKEDYIMHNVNFYRAELFTADFTKKRALEDVNKWISEKTDGMIEEMLKELEPETAMLLINTILFDAEWINKDEREEIPERIFYSEDGSISKLEMMYFEENDYIECENAVGFVKYYLGGRYAFIGLLPDEEILLKDYISSLSGDYLKKAFESRSSRHVLLQMPKFEYETDIDFRDYMENKKGILKPFYFGADFEEITPDNDVYVSAINHSAKITNNTNGTKAAAATVIIVEDECVDIMPDDAVEITLDRPFVYFIYDTEACIPLFVGAFNNK